MSTVTPEELLKLWKLDNIPMEMAMGHVLQNLGKQQKAQDALNQTLVNLRADVERLIAHTGLPPSAQSRR
ncbi:MAG: hypothetical protein U0350_12335 [Caldilineaceae bacterium]